MEWQDAESEKEGGRPLASSFGNYIDSDVFNQNVGYKGEECLSSHMELLSFHVYGTYKDTAQTRACLGEYSSH